MTVQHSWLPSLAAVIVLGASLPSALASPLKNFDLLLAGGALNTCSSMSQQHCNGTVDFGNAKVNIVYEIDNEGVERFRAATAGQVEQALSPVIRSLTAMASAPKYGVMTRRQLVDGIAEQAGSNLVQKLSDPAYFALLDSLESRQIGPSGRRKRESVRLDGNQSPHGGDIFKAFVNEADTRRETDQGKARIAVVTASSRDPFEVADFYLQVFEQAGAEVVWLPLDATYQRARALQDQGFEGCERLATIRATNLSFFRERIYPERTERQRSLCVEPEKLVAMIDSVQGIFFNGGDQSLTLAALHTPDGTESIELTRIKQRLSKGKLIVGGTSAGTAFQAGGSYRGRPVPMITNGHSEFAFVRGPFATPPPSQRCSGSCNPGIQDDDLTYRANGGAGFFDLGLLDTHFSERDRELRLAALTVASGQTFGFGVDEGTALLVNFVEPSASTAQFQVLGAGGVFVFDASALELNANGMGSSKVTRLSARSHYWLSGEQVTLANGKFQNRTGALPRRVSHDAPVETKGRWRRSVRQHCGSDKGWSTSLWQHQIWFRPDSKSIFFDAPDGSQCGYENLPFTLGVKAVD